MVAADVLFDREKIACARILCVAGDRLVERLERRGGPYLDVDVLAHLVMVTAEHFGRLVLDRPEEYDKERLIEALDGLLSATRPAPPPPPGTD